jgi:chemotaxis regulatin CheY-phosphate phosphatase CheZ
VTDPRTTEYNQQGDVWQHSYAYHAQHLRTAERSKDIVDMADRLEYRAQATEAGDRKSAQLMREAAARINALETLVLTLQATKKEVENGTE